MQPCSQPRYGLIERSKPMSGESLRAMIVRVASTASVVASRAGSSSEEPQPSSNGTRFSVSKRPLSLVPAPRPLRGWGWPAYACANYGVSVGTFQEHKPVSVVIPTLDAADELPGALAALAGSELVGEIVVSDGGSHDGTVAIVHAAGAWAVAGPRGRGPPLIAGAAAAVG